MLAKRIIPCLDVKDGRVVKGVNFVNIKDAGDPVELAQVYNEQGADELVFLDITASAEKRNIIKAVVERVAKKVFIPFTVGGGIRNTNDIRKMLKAGADKVALNTAALEDPKIVKDAAEKFGSQCIVVAIDAKSNKKMKSGYEVYTYGGRKATGIDALHWAKTVNELGAGEILLTSMDSDGTKGGFENKLTKLISTSVSIPVIASGGGGTIQHFVDTFQKGRADAALAASIFHYKEFTVADIKKGLVKKNIPVRK